MHDILMPHKDRAHILIKAGKRRVHRPESYRELLKVEKSTGWFMEDGLGADRPIGRPYGRRPLQRRDTLGRIFM